MLVTPNDTAEMPVEPKHKTHCSIFAHGNLYVYYSNTNHSINKEETMLKVKNIYSNNESYLSLSSRGKFRCMDIIDIIDKL